MILIKIMANGIKVEGDGRARRVDAPHIKLRLDNASRYPLVEHRRVQREHFRTKMTESEEDVRRRPCYLIDSYLVNGSRNPQRGTLVHFPHTIFLSLCWMFNSAREDIMNIKVGDGFSPSFMNNARAPYKIFIVVCSR